MKKTREESKNVPKRTRKVFDEVQKCDADLVDAIEVDAAKIDVKFHQWTSKTITVKFSGEADVASGDIEFDVYTIANKLFVTIDVKGIVQTSDLKLDIWIPGRVFNTIQLKASTANIEVDDGIAVKYLKVDTFSGDVNVYATYTKASISTNEGNVSVSINAQSRVELQVLTVQGDIEIRLKNIRKVNFRAKSKFGEILNSYKGKYGYIASIKATTKNGNITVE